MCEKGYFFPKLLSSNGSDNCRKRQSFDREGQSEVWKSRTSQITMDLVDIDDLQGDLAPAECLTSRIDGRGAVFLQALT
jgi:hypothetical protein